MFDLCIIGHITQDRIEIADETPRLQPGGTVFYAGCAARRLGLNTAVITSAHISDRARLLGDLANLGVDVRWIPSRATTKFINAYPSLDHDTRVQRVTSVAAPFRPEDLAVDARVFLLGPLTRKEISLDCVHRLAGTGRKLALDVQGLIRRVNGVEVVREPYDELPSLMRLVNVVKAGSDEALYITGSSTLEDAAVRLFAMGPSEVLVTSGSKGSLIFTGREFHRIPAYPPAVAVDSTGCGDTYLAAYLAYRFSSEDVEECGHFAARVASAKIEGHGAFRGTWSDGVSAPHLSAVQLGAGLKAAGNLAENTRGGLRHG